MPSGEAETEVAHVLDVAAGFGLEGVDLGTVAAMDGAGAGAASAIAQAAAAVQRKAGSAAHRSWRKDLMPSGGRASGKGRTHG